MFMLVAVFVVRLMKSFAAVFLNQLAFPVVVKARESIESLKRVREVEELAV